MTEPRWIEWSRQLQALAQSGLTYTTNPFDLQRYEALREIALDIAEHHTDADVSEARAVLRELVAAGVGYPTPKVDVRAFVPRGDEVLLVRERIDGRWSLPGGWADMGSTVAEMAAREVLEEAGYVVKPMRVLAVWDRGRNNPGVYPDSTYKVFMACELLGGEATTSIETDAVDWFALDDLPPLSEGRVTPHQIARLRELHADPAAPAAFD